MHHQYAKAQIHQSFRWLMLAIAVFSDGHAYAEKGAAEQRSFSESSKAGTAASVSVVYDKHQNRAIIIRSKQSDNRAFIILNGSKNLGKIDQATARNATAEITSNGSNNSASATQTGSNGTVRIAQTATGSQVKVTQTNSGEVGNRAGITQTNALLDTANVNQSGAGNTISAIQSGSHNTINATQTGLNRE